MYDVTYVNHFPFILIRCASANISQYSSCVNGTDSWISSENVLQMLEINWSLYVCILALLAFSVVLRIAGYLILRYVRCP